MTRSKGTGSLYKHRNGRWIGIVEIPTADGTRQRRTVSSKDRGEAARKLNKLLAEVDSGKVAKTSKATVGQYLSHWLEDIHKAEVRPTTYTYYEQTIRLHISPEIGSKRLDQLTQADVRDMIHSIQKRSTRAAQKAHQVLSLALRDAVSDELIDRNVAAAVRKPKHTKKIPQALTADAARLIIRTAIDNHDPMASRWAGAFFTGARQSELLGLTWDRVDLVNGTIDLEWQLQRLSKVHGCYDDDEAFPTCGKDRPGWCPQAKWDLPPGFEYVECYKSMIWTRPKTNAGRRIVPLAEPLRLLLIDHRENSLPGPFNLVWEHPDGRPIGPKEDHKNWRNALQAAGFREPFPRLHDARHTTATLLANAGVPEDVRMLIMGQSSVVAHRGYAHIDQTLSREAVKKLDMLILDPHIIDVQETGS